jgi:hypothetical protein
MFASVSSAHEENHSKSSAVSQFSTTVLTALGLCRNACSSFLSLPNASCRLSAYIMVVKCFLTWAWFFLAHRIDHVEHLVIPAKLLPRLGITSPTAAHNPRFPSPTNSCRLLTPRVFSCRSTQAHDSLLSRCPGSKAKNRLLSSR